MLKWHRSVLSAVFDCCEQEKNNLEQRILQLNEASLRYREEHAELKEDLKGKDNEIRLIEKVQLIFVVSFAI